MKILYFARFRQIIGRSSDELDLPGHILSARDLIQHLSSTDANCAAAFTNLKTVKVAIDQNHAELSASIAGAREVAFFPPVTGG
jgi:sulfur-carrier protein